VDRFLAAREKAQTLGDDWLTADTLRGEALARLQMGDPQAAHQAAAATMGTMTASADGYGAAMNGLVLGFTEAALGEFATATGRFQTALGQAQAAGAHIGIAMALEALASMSLAAGEPARAVKLGSAAEALRKSIGGMVSITVAGRQPPLDEARGMLDPADYDRAAAEGAALTTDAAVALALHSADRAKA
jgi:hypothetical protein